MRKFVLTALCVGVMAAMVAGSATGAASRKAFVKQVDPICKQEQQRAAGILRKAGNGEQAMGKAWATIARKGRAALADIYRIGAAPADVITYDRWIQHDQRENALVVRMARSLKAGNSGKAAMFRQKATDADKRAEKVIRDFGFDYCDRSTLGTP